MKGCGGPCAARHSGKRPSNMPDPMSVVVLGRLAVATSHHGQRLGRSPGRSRNPRGAVAWRGWLVRLSKTKASRGIGPSCRMLCGNRRSASCVPRRSFKDGPLNDGARRTWPGRWARKPPPLSSVWEGDVGERAPRMLSVNLFIEPSWRAWRVCARDREAVRAIPKRFALASFVSAGDRALRDGAPKVRPLHALPVRSGIERPAIWPPKAHNA